MVKNKDSEQKFNDVLTSAVITYVPRIVYWLQTNELTIKTYKVIEIGSRWQETKSVSDITAPDELVTVLKLKGFPLATSSGGVQMFELNAPNLFFNMDEAFEALDNLITALTLDATRKESPPCAE